MPDRLLGLAATRTGIILLTGAACAVLLNIKAPYPLQLAQDIGTGDLAELPVGLLLAVAMLARGRWVFPGCVAIHAAAWAVISSAGGRPAALLGLGLLAAVPLYAWVWLCARWMGWPREPERQVVSVPDLYRFALFGLLLVPLGHALLVFAYVSWSGSPKVPTNALLHALFGRFFGICIITMPLVIAWTERRRVARLAAGSLWSLLVLLLLTCTVLGSVWLLRQSGDVADTVVALTDYRIALIALVGWCIVSLRLSLSMLMLSLALFGMVLHLGLTAQIEHPPGFFSLLHRALETGIVLLALLHYALLSRDRADMTARLLHRTLHDTLTGLPNLRALRQAATQRTDGTLACLLLDRGGDIRIGDGLDTHVDVMQAVARAASACAVQPYQLDDRAFALLPDKSHTDWAGILHRIERQEFGAHGQRMRLSAYLGVARFGTGSGVDMQAALVLASRLAVQARRRHEVEPLYADAVHAPPEPVRGSIRETGQALAWLRQPDGLVLYFQPIIALDRQPQAAGHPEVSGEVLCRLRNDAGTLLAPGQFLPTIEAARRGPELDLAVIARLFDELRTAPELVVGCARISVNLTGQSLAPDSFRLHLMELLDHAPLPLSKLCFEITETPALYSSETAGHLLDELRRRGCRIALDDFGAGMQSFARLKELQMDIIKIDGSFVRNITREDRDHAMVEATVLIARACRAEVVAEFVEDEATATCLRRLGVQWGQGYLYARPMPLLDGLRSLPAAVHAAGGGGVKCAAVKRSPGWLRPVSADTPTGRSAAGRPRVRSADGSRWPGGQEPRCAPGFPAHPGLSAGCVQ